MRIDVMVCAVWSPLPVRLCNKPILSPNAAPHFLLFPIPLSFGRLM